MKTFNHENLIVQKKLVALGGSAKVNDNELGLEKSKNNFNEEIQRNDCRSYLTTNESKWKIEENYFINNQIVEEKMQNFNLNEPLDLRVSNKRFNCD